MRLAGVVGFPYIKPIYKVSDRTTRSAIALYPAVVSSQSALTAASAARATSIGASTSTASSHISNTRLGHRHRNWYLELLQDSLGLIRCRRPARRFGRDTNQVCGRDALSHQIIELVDMTLRRRHNRRLVAQHPTCNLNSRGVETNGRTLCETKAGAWSSAIDLPGFH